MNHRGFTLIELLSTIVVLGLIISISIYTYVKIQDKSLLSNLEAKLKIAEISANKYGEENKDLIWEKGGCEYIKIKKLISEGYLPSDSPEGIYYKSPVDESDLSNKAFKICYNDGKTSTSIIDKFPAYLKSLSTTVNNIKPNFNKDILTYNVEVPFGTTKIKVDAVVGEAYMEFSPGYGPREVVLNIGEGVSTSISIKVKSEDEEKNYKINVKMLEKETPNYALLSKSYKCSNSTVGSSPFLMTYTGKCTIAENGDENWKIKFLTSGTLTFTKDVLIDAFLVGGGGGGGQAGGYPQDSRSSGGGSGYTTTINQYRIIAGTKYTITIGAGGTARASATSGGRGGSSIAFGGTAAGGYPGSGCYACYPKGGAGGSNGGNSGYYGATNGSPGQGTTTREFGEATGQLYATGGGTPGYINGGNQANTGNGGSSGLDIKVKSCCEYRKYTGYSCICDAPWGAQSYATNGGTGIVVIRSIRNVRKIGDLTVTFTGASEYIDDGNGNWRLKLLSNGNLKINSTTKVDIFLVGGGGGGGFISPYNTSGFSSGGGGGYTATLKNVSLVGNEEYSVTIGKGGTVNANGNATTGFGKTVGGGKSGSTSTTNANIIGGIGGSNGGTANCGAGATNGSPGQNTTTREFGEETGPLYGSGGGGASDGCGQNLSNENNYYTGNGGSGGVERWQDYKGWDKYRGYCVLGKTTSGNVTMGTQGASGVIVIRNAR